MGFFGFVALVAVIALLIWLWMNRDTLQKENGVEELMNSTRTALTGYFTKTALPERNSVRTGLPTLPDSMILMTQNGEKPTPSLTGEPSSTSNDPSVPISARKDSFVGNAELKPNSNYLKVDLNQRRSKRATKKDE